MHRHQLQTNSEKIKELARVEGFDACGVSKSDFLSEEAPRLEKWLKESQHGEMGWMDNHFDKRLDPRLLVEGSKSVITVLYNYYPENQQNAESYKVAKYAYGEDYHFVMKRKLKSFAQSIEDNFGAFNYRVFVDSAPVMDRVWAKKSGLGWIGKHTLLINKQKGSYFFIGHIIGDLELNPDTEVKDFCGTCTKCMDACPTDAISSKYWLDASKCISYLTIELKNEIPDDFKGQMEDWIFGCDICQDICPWNRFSEAHNEPAFKPLDAIIEQNKSDWQNMTEDSFKKVFKKSPLKRSKFLGLKRNIDFIKPK